MDSTDLTLNLSPTFPADWIVCSENHLDLGSDLNGRTVVFSGSPARRIVVDSNVQATLIEIEHRPTESKCHRTEIELKPFANVQHVRLQILPRTANHDGQLSVIQHESSQLNTFSFNIGSEGSVMTTDVHQQGPMSETHVFGLFLAKQGQRRDNFVRVYHESPHGMSRQHFKGLVAEGGHAKFFGKIRIEKHAQKVDSRQSSATLICGRRADMQTQPELEILADDVKAAHGASIGRMSDEEVFYFRSRGLDQHQAVQLIARGFMDEIFLQIKNPELRSFVTQSMNTSMTEFENQFVQSLERS